MNFNLDSSLYSDGIVNLSDKIDKADWRRLRTFHMKGVIFYEQDGKNLYQCSCCKTFHHSLDLHDFWHFDSEDTRRLDSLENLCYTCHAMNHLERIYDLNGEVKSDNYRGVNTQDLIKSFEKKTKVVYNREYSEMLNEVLQREQKRQKHLVENGLVIHNSYRLIELLNESIWSKYPITLKK
jgi:hypothetical protein